MQNVEDKGLRSISLRVLPDNVLICVSLFFFPFSFIYLFQRQRDKERVRQKRKRVSIASFTPQVPAIPRAGLGPKLRIRSAIYVSLVGGRD